MIFSYEVHACLDGSASVSEQREHIDQYNNGGFHQNVLTVERAAFIRWLDDLVLHPLHVFGNTRQLDLLEDLAA